jgi:hypothetical protein
MKKNQKLYCLFYVISSYDGSFPIGIYSSPDALQEAKQQYIKKYCTEDGKIYNADDENFETYEIMLDAPASGSIYSNEFTNRRNSTSNI